MAKHTGGEWAVWQQGEEIQGDGGHEVGTVIDGIPVSICEIPLAQTSSVANPDGPDDEYEVSEEESLANARLIAKAPEMLAALEKVVKRFEGRNNDELAPGERNALEYAAKLVREING